MQHSKPFPVDNKRESPRRAEDVAIPERCKTAIEQGIQDGLTKSVAEGVELAYKKLASDKEFCDKFWKGGFERWTDHAKSGTAMWVWGKLWTFIVAGGSGLFVFLLVKTGVLK